MITDLFLWQKIIFGIIFFLYGIVIGSFLNVCIYRIPLKESLSKERSHCMKCGYQLRWFDLVPLFSYLFLGGKCRKCKEHISAQYPIVEGLNGVLYVLTFLVNGWSIDSVIYCLLISALIVLSVIDFRTYEIPFGINVFILALGLIHLGFHLGDWVTYVIGLFAVSTFLEIIFRLSGGRAIGYGDVRLMRASGLLLGWQLSILSLIIGCVLGSIIHVIRMKLSNEDHVLAMGPYLAMGIFVAALWGQPFMNWYISLLVTH